MPDVNTTTSGTGTRLQVANARADEAGHGIAPLGRGFFDSLGFRPGDPVEIVGRRHTGAVAIPASPEDEGLNIIRLDGLERINAGVSSGDHVEVLRRGAPRHAHRACAGAEEPPPPRLR